MLAKLRQEQQQIVCVLIGVVLGLFITVVLIPATLTLENQTIKAYE